MPATSLPTPAASPDSGQYRIAAVSSLTGIPVPTIRIWEFRYQAVQPARSSGNSRLYSRADVDRLILLKAAVDAGFQIGTVAKLPDARLRERVQTLLHRPAARIERRHQMVIVGEMLAARLSSVVGGRDDVEVAALLADLDALPNSPPTADFLIADLPSLSTAGVQSLRRARVAMRPQVTVVLYSYANRRTLEQLDEEGVIALSAPADPVHLLRICQLGLGSGDGQTTPIERLLRTPAAPRRYDLPFLGSLRDMPSQVQCECPNHLAELLGRLGAFEQYSLGCESRNQADALIHARLYAAASHCREVLEHVLGEVLDHEGIEQPPTRATGGSAAP